MKKDIPWPSDNHPILYQDRLCTPSLKGVPEGAYEFKVKVILKKDVWSFDYPTLIEIKTPKGPYHSYDTVMDILALALFIIALGIGLRVLYLGRKDA